MDIILQDIQWKKATLVHKSECTSTDGVLMCMKFKLENTFSFLPGQYCNIRINTKHTTSPRRSYSIVSVESTSIIEFGIKIIPQGELSQLLYSTAVGDEVEIQGPLGNHFIWNPTIHQQTTPLILLASGSGIAPLMSIIRARSELQSQKQAETILIYSVKHPKEFAYESELTTLEKNDPHFTFTRITTLESDISSAYTKRIDMEVLHKECDRFLDRIPSIYIAGSSDFVNTMSDHLQSIGFDEKTIYTESFI
jgi:ferredoxin-NADP reductase